MKDEPAPVSDLAQTSVYLNAEDRRIAAELMERLDLNRSALYRMALQRMYEATDDRREELLRIADRIKEIA